MTLAPVYISKHSNHKVFDFSQSTEASDTVPAMGSIESF